MFDWTIVYLFTMGKSKSLKKSYLHLKNVFSEFPPWVMRPKKHAWMTRETNDRWDDASVELSIIPNRRKNERILIAFSHYDSNAWRGMCPGDGECQENQGEATGDYIDWSLAFATPRLLGLSLWFRDQSLLSRALTSSPAQGLFFRWWWFAFSKASKSPRVSIFDLSQSDNLLCPIAPETPLLPSFCIRYQLHLTKVRKGWDNFFGGILPSSRKYDVLGPEAAKAPGAGYHDGLTRPSPSTRARSMIPLPAAHADQNCSAVTAPSKDATLPGVLFAISTFILLYAQLHAIDVIPVQVVNASISFLFASFYTPWCWVEETGLICCGWLWKLAHNWHFPGVYCQWLPGHRMGLENGYLSFLTPKVWMRALILQ